MKKRNVLLLGLVLSSGAQATFITAEYAWTGTTNGWSAFGTVRFDDAVAAPTARGAALGGYSQGIEFLDLEITNNAGTRIGYWVQIDAFVPLYNTLNVTLNSAALTFAPGLNFEAGITNGSRATYFAARPGSQALIVNNRVVTDRGATGALPLMVSETPVPAPSALWAMGLGLALLIVRRRP